MTTSSHNQSDPRQIQTTGRAASPTPVEALSRVSLSRYSIPALRNSPAALLTIPLKRAYKCVMNTLMPVDGCRPVFCRPLI